MDKQPRPRVDSWIRSQPALGTDIFLSVIIPAFNEEWRLPPTLIDTIDYLDEQPWSYEIVVVDDGSSDNTVGIVKKFEKIRSQVTLLRLPKNYGKGHAVKTGVLNARGRFVVFSDADGSTPIREVDRLLEALDEDTQIAIGSRALQSEETKVKSKWYRKLPGRIFNFCVNTYLLPDFKDTQCGFKLFGAKHAQFLFSKQTADGFSFDLEILFLCNRIGARVKEVPVNWVHVPGSKVNMLKDAILMLRDMVIFRFRHSGVKRQDFEAFLKQQEAESNS
ncbi:MAG: glycosyltransferase family 2 protein [Bdellovibrionales bacterium]|nr:glycosyltransferase family 2 protein [Bdellovibrionales bacterium]